MEHNKNFTLFFICLLIFLLPCGAAFNVPSSSNTSLSTHGRERRASSEERALGTAQAGISNVNLPLVPPSSPASSSTSSSAFTNLSTEGKPSRNTHSQSQQDQVEIMEDEQSDVAHFSKIVQLAENALHRIAKVICALLVSSAFPGEDAPLDVLEFQNEFQASLVGSITGGIPSASELFSATGVTHTDSSRNKLEMCCAVAMWMGIVTFSAKMYSLLANKKPTAAAGTPDYRQSQELFAIYCKLLKDVLKMKDETREAIHKLRILNSGEVFEEALLHKFLLIHEASFVFAIFSMHAVSNTLRKGKVAGASSDNNNFLATQRLESLVKYLDPKSFSVVNDSSFMYLEDARNKYKETKVLFDFILDIEKAHMSEYPTSYASNADILRLQQVDQSVGWHYLREIEKIKDLYYLITQDGSAGAAR